MNLCKCGCGLLTQIISKTSQKQKRIKGEYNLFLKGHSARLFSNEERLIRAKRLKENNPMWNISPDKKEKWRKEISISTQGRIPWDKGKKRPEISGEKHPRWKGGKVINGDYVSLLMPNGYRMKEHRLVVSQHLKRHLKSDEIIHHINGKKMDNRLINLLIMTPNEHAKYHATTDRRRIEQTILEKV